MTSGSLVLTGNLVIAAGDTTGTIEIPIFNDHLYEGDEVFTVTLSNASAGSIADATAIVTITDNELSGNLGTGTNPAHGPYTLSPIPLPIVFLQLFP